MAYMRGDPYVYVVGGKKPEDEGVIEIHSSTLKGYMALETFDKLVVMRVGELIRDGLFRDVAIAVAKEYSGNFGSWGLQELLGGDPERDFKAWATSLRKPDAEPRGKPSEPDG